MRTVLFDFDGTLTIKDTVRPFAVYVARQYKCRWKLLILIIVLSLYKLKVFSDSRLKEMFLKLFFSGKCVAEVSEVARGFLEEGFSGSGFANLEILEKLKKHVAAGDQVVLVSANFDFFLAPLMTMFGVSRIIATKAETKAGVLTGRIIGDSCKGKKKISCVIDVLGEASLRKSIVYGDREDFALMSAAEQSFSVDSVL